ncbi:MAG: hypothetical protein LBV28_00005, partial [Puniceicoccales bacterium]|nr:hypothetical protein [Puniceicoccales bacterium]
MKSHTFSLLSAALVSLAAHLSAAPTAPSATTGIIPTSLVADYVEKFNANDEELYPQLIHNKDAADFLTRNIPRFECPDRELEEIYYFRWWTYRKHIKQTPEGFIITEFLPSVQWAGKYNGIACAAVYHYGEGRWLQNHEYLDGYAKYWFRQGGQIRRYSFPVAFA